MASSAKKHGSTANGKKVTVQTDTSGHSRDKVERVTRIAVERYEKAMKELAKH